MVLKPIGRMMLAVRRAARGVERLFLRSQFLACGTNVRFDPRDTFAFENIEIGNDVFIGPGAKFLADRSVIRIGNKVLFGPNVTIIGGDHNASVIGEFMHDVKIKRPEDDADVTVEDDVWVGGGATILKGVRLGRGCIVAAGSIVTREVSPYSIVAGVPAKVVRPRFNTDEVLRHEAALYPEAVRLPREVLTRAWS